MLLLNSQLTPKPVVSIHAGSVVAAAKKPVINPHNLTIAGFFVEYNYTEERILVNQDVREVTNKGYIINHEEDLSPLVDLIRFNELVELDFELIGKEVRTESKKKLGTVEEYVVQSEGLVIYNLHVRQPTWKSFTSAALVINRRQIVEVTQKKIIVKDAVIEEPAGAAVQPAVAG